MDLTPELVYQALTTAITGGALYGGIRADLRATREKADQAQRTADTAHKRIDSIIELSLIHI